MSLYYSILSRGLEEQADQLFATRRSEKREFYRTYDQLAEAAREVKEGTLTFEAYQQARKNLAEVQEKHRGLTHDRAHLEERKSAIDRASRVLPLLGQLSEMELDIGSYADVSRVRHEFASEVRETLRAHAEAAGELEEAARRYGELEGQINRMSVDRAVLDSEAEISTIREMSASVGKEREDRPKREQELEEQKAKLVRLREFLGLEPGTDPLTYLPPIDVRENVRKLMIEGFSLEQQKTQVTKRIQGNENRLRSISREQKNLSGQGFHRPLIIEPTTFKALPRSMREAENRRQRTGKSEEQINRRLAAWGFENIQDLSDFRCPDADTVEEEITRRKGLQEQIEFHSERLREAKETLSSAAMRIERLQAAGEVPTEAAIERARSARKAAWQPIRSAYLSDDPEALRAVPRPEREGRANHLEERTEGADRLADRKSAEARRLTDLAAAQKEWDQATITIRSSQEARDELREDLAEGSRRFSEVWPQAVQKEADLVQLKQLARERNAILEKVAEVSKLRDEANDRQSEVDTALASLALAEADLGIHPDPGTSLERRVDDLQQAASEYLRSHKEWVQNAAISKELDDQLAEDRGELERLRAAGTRWKQRWLEAMEHAGLPGDAPIEFAEQALKECSEAGPALALSRSIQHRLDRFHEDENELAQRISILRPRLGFQLPDDPLAAAKMLNHRLEEAKGLEAKRGEVKRQKEAAAEDLGRKKQHTEELNRQVLGLCDEAGVDQSNLKGTAARLEELIQKRDLRTQKILQITAAGDGKSHEELRAGCKDLDPDKLRAELEEIRSANDRVDQEIQQAYAEIKSRESELQQFTAAAGINSAESRRQSAAAEMRAVIERYLEVKLAHALLTQAIDRLREERQDPLVSRAGELFKLATRGSYVGIGADIDDRGVPVVVGKRPTGEEVHVDVMSDGTRDQLFLAFRIASVEQYCRQSGPVPFIADDLLVHFDDERSAAALQLLAELGCNTQVLLFTHHRSVRNLAPTALKPSSFAVTDLAS